MLNFDSRPKKREKKVSARQTKTFVIRVSKVLQTHSLCFENVDLCAGFAGYYSDGI